MQYCKHAKTLIRMTQKKYGKKMSLTEDERKGIEFGTIPHVKKTETYKKAHDFFKKECNKLTKSAYELDRNTHIWFDELDMSMKMRFVTVRQENLGNVTMEDFNDIFGDLFGKS